MIKFKQKQQYRRFAVILMKHMQVEHTRPVKEVLNGLESVLVRSRCNASFIKVLPSFVNIEIKLNINETADFETIRKYAHEKYDIKTYQVVSWAEIT